MKGTRKESSKGMPVVSTKASWIRDMGYGIWDFGLAVWGLVEFIEFVGFIEFIGFFELVV